MISIYSDNISKRQEYIFRFVFSDLLNVDFEIVSDSDDFRKRISSKINYSQKLSKTSLNILPEKLLFETTISKKDLKVGEYKNHIVFFRNEKTGFFPFDVFSAIFFMISRYEEYIDFESDEHNRFLSINSAANKYGIIDLPIVEIWAGLLKTELLVLFPNLKFGDKEYKYIPTIDVDNAFAIRYKGLRTYGGILKSLFKGNLPVFINHIKVILGLLPDSYDTYKYIDEVHSQKCLIPIFFFLLGNLSKHDRNISWKSKNLRKLIGKLNEQHKIGIHPSYNSNFSLEKIKTEIWRLSQILNREIKISRQHYLMLKMPNTFRNLISCGIETDYSLGFHDTIGFRAGTCTPFYFFDLDSNSVSSLRIMPFQIMDVTLKNYMRLSKEEAIENIYKIVENVKKVNGTFVSLWHNESFSENSEWKGWREVYESLIKIAVE